MRSKKVKTLERKEAAKNGITRMLFVAGSVLFQILFTVFVFSKLGDYAEWIRRAFILGAAVIVLGLYSQNRTSSMKMPWIILILLFPIAGVVLYLLVGLDGSRNFMWKYYRRIDEMIMPKLGDGREAAQKLRTQSVSSANLASYVQKTSGFPVYQHTRVTYHRSASQGLAALLRQLKKAKTFIFMEYYAIEDAQAWKLIEEILVQKAKDGLDVRLFYDDIGSIHFINTDFVDKLQEMGIKCKVFNPCIPGLNLFLNNRDHRKITVIDDQVAFTGGYNLADEYFNITKPYGSWKDAGVMLRGEAAHSLTVMFLEMWYADRKHMIEELPLKDVEMCHLTAGTNENLLEENAEEGSFIQPFAAKPMDKERVGEGVYINILNQARTYCYFMTPYLIITDEMNSAMQLAAKRGVDVRIITPGIPDKKLVFEVTRSFYHGLAEANVRIFEWSPGFCHSKICLSDDKVAVCGTINLDYRSLYHHFEDACVLYGGSVLLAMKKDFQKSFLEAQEVTDDYRGRLSKPLRFEQLVLRLFAELL